MSSRSDRQPKWGLVFRENYVTPRASSCPRDPEESPFWDLYLRTSDRGVLPFRGKVAFILDALLRIIVALAIIGVALGVAWKTLSPFPHF
jgi:hypothetical protein